ncbi:uncharacterized protein LOC124894172 [Capsicum annuum]|uniref:uncharacterized protein LOC124894172 n=1 Tax=Capsicum annuum TaxID=4072 RepID=UPI001FB135D1|nr:uncharacterized protein LOC124894172 [Capsicum annuum]
MFENDARSKAKFTMWFHFHGNLLTVDRLLRWGLKLSPTCVLCLMQDETRDHLFLSCAFAQTLWTRMLHWIHKDAITASIWEDYTMWAIKNAKSRSQRVRIFKLVFAECVHTLWIEGNQRIFEEKQRTCDSLAKVLAYTCITRAKPTISTLLHNYRF